MSQKASVFRLVGIGSRKGGGVRQQLLMLVSISVAVVTNSTRPADEYKALLPRGLGLAHVIVEVNHAGVTPTQRQEESKMT